jgi:hypothetical protein
VDGLINVLGIAVGRELRFRRKRFGPEPGGNRAILPEPRRGRRPNVRGSVFRRLAAFFQSIGRAGSFRPGCFRDPVEIWKLGNPCKQRLQPQKDLDNDLVRDRSDRRHRRPDQHTSLPTAGPRSQSLGMFSSVTPRNN